MIQLGF